MFRSRHSQMFFKIILLKKFVNFTGKHLCWSLLWRSSELQVYWKETLTRFFLLWILWIVQKLFCVEDLWTAGSETLVRLFKNTFFTEHLQWLFLTISGVQPAGLLKKALQQRRFLWVCKIFKNIFLQNTSGWLLFVVNCDIEKFFRSPIL